MRKPAAMALLSLAFVAGTAGAQSIYRCGNAYSDEPCPGASTVAPVRAPSAEAAAASRRETEREMKMANAMEAARLKEEARPAAAYIPREKVEKAEEKKPDMVIARLPADPKKQKGQKGQKAPKKKAPPKA